MIIWIGEPVDFSIPLHSTMIGVQDCQLCAEQHCVMKQSFLYITDVHLSQIKRTRSEKTPLEHLPTPFPWTIAIRWLRCHTPLEPYAWKLGNSGDSRGQNNHSMLSCMMPRISSPNRVLLPSKSQMTSDLLQLIDIWTSNLSLNSSQKERTTNEMNRKQMRDNIEELILLIDSI